MDGMQETFGEDPGVFFCYKILLQIRGDVTFAVTVCNVK